MYIIGPTHLRITEGIKEITLVKKCWLFAGTPGMAPSASGWTDPDFPLLGGQGGVKEVEDLLLPAPPISRSLPSGEKSQWMISGLKLCPPNPKVALVRRSKTSQLVTSFTNIQRCRKFIW